MPTDFRTAPRYFVMSALPATLGAIDANVVDLSIRGARLHMTQPMSIGSLLPFRLQTAVAMIQDRPLLGFGWNQFATAHGPYIRESPNIPLTATNITSSWL